MLFQRKQILSTLELRALIHGIQPLHPKLHCYKTYEQCRVIKYLQSTMEVKLTLEADDPITVQWWMDASHSDFNWITSLEYITD